MNNTRSAIHLFRMLTVMAIAIAAAHTPLQSEECSECRTACGFAFAIKTNLIHDALLTPDLGIELSVARQWSLSAQGVYAWWGNRPHNFFWRIRGGSLELRHWFGSKSHSRALTGHHVGIYGSIHDYDFEFGHTGYQAAKPTFGIGATYGYSIRLTNRQNLDFGIKIGYSAGKQVKYHPECCTYVCDSHRTFRYFGPTGVEISLIWFPGRHSFNRPKFPNY